MQRLTVVALLLACLLAFLLWDRPSTGQAPAAAAPGRYQVAVTRNQTGTQILYLDTATGRLWWAALAAGDSPTWRELKAPQPGMK